MKMTVLLALGLALAPSIASAKATPEQITKMIFAKYDTNKDGVLTLDEWKAAGRKQQGFDLADADHDGKVTPAEATALLTQMQR